MTHLEARILSMTMPETAMSCDEFENLLTDYLDGFLPAQVFHRWERHAVLCEKCTDLPGEVGLVGVDLRDVTIGAEVGHLIDGAVLVDVQVVPRHLGLRGVALFRRRGGGRDEGRR